MSLDFSPGNDRLSVIYLIKCYGKPIPATVLMQTVLDGHFMTYINLQQTVSELSDAGYISTFGEASNVCHMLTEKGESTLAELKDLVSQYIVRYASFFVPKAVQHGTAISASYTADDIDRYIVHLSVYEDSILVFNIDFTVYSKSDAINLCDKFEKYSGDISSDLINSLLKNRGDAI